MKDKNSRIRPPEHPENCPRVLDSGPHGAQGLGAGAHPQGPLAKAKQSLSALWFLLDLGQRQSPAQPGPLRSAGEKQAGGCVSPGLQHHEFPLRGKYCDGSSLCARSTGTRHPLLETDYPFVWSLGVLCTQDTALHRGGR